VWRCTAANIANSVVGLSVVWSVFAPLFTLVWSHLTDGAYESLVFEVSQPSQAALHLQQCRTAANTHVYHTDFLWPAAAAVAVVVVSRRCFVNTFVQMLCDGAAFQGQALFKRQGGKKDKRRRIKGQNRQSGIRRYTDPSGSNTCLEYQSFVSLSSPQPRVCFTASSS
jgi:hypothetical protein